MKNDFISIAENDLEYLKFSIDNGSTFYNQMSVTCQQITEKYLKGCIELLFVNEDVTNILRKHSLKKMAVLLNSTFSELDLDTIGLAYLNDYYFDARYPGDDFTVVTKEEFSKCYEIMQNTVSKINKKLRT